MLPFFVSYLDYVMLTYERYQALHAIHIRVPGEPGNEATVSVLLLSTMSATVEPVARGVSATPDKPVSFK